MYGGTSFTMLSCISDDTDEEMIDVTENGSRSPDSISSARGANGNVREAGSSVQQSIINVDPHSQHRQQRPRLPSRDHDVSELRKRSKR